MHYYKRYGLLLIGHTGSNLLPTGMEMVSICLATNIYKVLLDVYYHRGDAVLMSLKREICSLIPDHVKLYSHSYQKTAEKH